MFFKPTIFNKNTKRKNDQNLLKTTSSNTKPSAFHDLEQQIVEQIFEAETLEKRVGRREDLISAVVEGLGDAVIVFDKNFKIRFTNPSACKLFGWPSPPLELNAVEQLNNNELINLKKALEKLETESGSQSKV